MLVLRDSGMNDTYCTFVHAFDVAEAERSAQAEAWEADNEDADPEDMVGDPDDYFVLMVVRGFHPDVRTQ